MKDRLWWWSCLSTAPCGAVLVSLLAGVVSGVWNLVRLLVAGGVDTLLGPEGSGWSGGGVLLSWWAVV